MEGLVANLSLLRSKTKSNQRQLSQLDQLISGPASGPASGSNPKSKPKTKAKTRTVDIVEGTQVRHIVDGFCSTSEDRVLHSTTQITDSKQELMALQQIEPGNVQLEGMRELVVRYKKAVCELENHVTVLEKENTELKQGLHLCFAEMTLSSSIVHSDAHYREKLEELNYFICASVAKLCAIESTKRGQGPYESLKAALQTAGESGAYGNRDSSRLLAKLGPNRRKDPKRLMAFTRYLISLLLYKHVFSLFAFGLDSLQSSTMKGIERRLVSCGKIFDFTSFNVDSNLSQVVSVRHALARAVSFQLQHSGRIDIAKANLVDVIERTLFHLYPESSDIRQMASKIVTMAVATQGEMIVEPGLFWCKWVDIGSDPVNERAKVVDESQKGKVALCTFPGFWKRVRQDKCENWIPIILPWVELESMFQ